MVKRTIILIISVIVNECVATSLVKHCLQLNPKEPTVSTPKQAQQYLAQQYLSSLPKLLLLRDLKCSEYSDPRIQPLCRYVARASEKEVTGELGLRVTQDFQLLALSPSTIACFSKISKSTPFYTIIELCASEVNLEEDRVIDELKRQIKSEKFTKAEQKALIGYLEGAYTIVKDCRPLPFYVKILVALILVLAVLVMSVGFYKWFGAEYNFELDRQGSSTLL